MRVRIRHHFTGVAEPASPIVEHLIDLSAASRTSVQLALFSKSKLLAPLREIGKLKGKLCLKASLETGESVENPCQCDLHLGGPLFSRLNEVRLEPVNRHYQCSARMLGICRTSVRNITVKSDKT